MIQVKCQTTEIYDDIQMNKQYVRLIWCDTINLYTKNLGEQPKQCDEPETD